MSPQKKKRNPQLQKTTVGPIVIVACVSSWSKLRQRQSTAMGSDENKTTFVGLVRWPNNVEITGSFSFFWGSKLGHQFQQPISKLPMANSCLGFWVIKDWSAEQSESIFPVLVRLVDCNISFRIIQSHAADWNHFFVFLRRHYNVNPVIAATEQLTESHLKWGSTIPLRS